jgi:hypothetical protein
MGRIAAVLLAALALAGAAAATSSPPRLTVATRTPTLVVRGSGFHARERVTVTASATVLHVRATRLGSFTLDTGVALSRCSGAVVRAVGSMGSIALLKLPQPACMPAKSP